MFSHYIIVIGIVQFIFCILSRLLLLFVLLLYPLLLLCIVIVSIVIVCIVIVYCYCIHCYCIYCLLSLWTWNIVSYCYNIVAPEILRCHLHPTLDPPTKPCVTTLWGYPRGVFRIHQLESQPCCPSPPHSTGVPLSQHPAAAPRRWHLQRVRPPPGNAARWGRWMD